VKPKLDDQLITRYLLGDASTAEEQQIEELYFADDNCFEHLLSVEDELIDAYVSGDMTGEKRKRFEDHFLSSSERKQRVAFAQTLFASASKRYELRIPAVSGRERNSWWLSLPGFWRVPQPVMQVFVLAGFALLVIAGSLSVMQNRNLRDQLTRIQADGLNLRREVELQRELHQQLNEQLEQERVARSRLEQSLPNLQKQPAIASFILMPGSSRSSNEIRPLLIRRGTDVLQLQLNVETQGNFQYQVDVRTADDQEIWSQDGLRARPRPAGGAVRLSLPANLLVPGDYLILLQMITATGETEDVGQYVFRTIIQ
jgi:hypothetical protein